MKTIKIRHDEVRADHISAVGLFDPDPQVLQVSIFGRFVNWRFASVKEAQAQRNRIIREWKAAMGFKWPPYRPIFGRRLKPLRRVHNRKPVTQKRSR